jgi:hypothetical protein
MCSYYILSWLDLSLNTPPVVWLYVLCLLIQRNRNASDRNLKPFKCFNHFFSRVHFSFAYDLEYLTHILPNHLDTRFLKVCIGSNFSPLLETVGLGIPSRDVRKFSLLKMCSSHRNVLLNELQVLLFSDINVFGTKIFLIITDYNFFLAAVIECSLLSERYKLLLFVFYLCPFHFLLILMVILLLAFGLWINI